MCTVLLPPGVNTIAVNKYICISIYQSDGRAGAVFAMMQSLDEGFYLIFIF
jgi:hypothetical protein